MKPTEYSDKTKYFQFNLIYYPTETYYNELHKQNNKKTKEYEDKIPKMKTKAWGILQSHSPEYPDLYLIDETISYGYQEDSSITISPNIPFISKFKLTIQLKRNRENGRNEIDLECINRSVCSVEVNGAYYERKLKCFDSLLIRAAQREEISYTYIDFEAEFNVEKLKYTNDFLNDYQFGKPIFSKNHSYIYEIIPQTPKLMSEKKKIVKTRDKKWLRYPKMKDKEIKNLKRIKHQNILTVDDVYESENHLFLVMDKMDGSYLFNRFSYFDEMKPKTLKEIFRNILTAIKYLHENKIVHGHIRANNMLLFSEDDENDSRCLLTDIGFDINEDNIGVYIDYNKKGVYTAPENFADDYNKDKKEYDEKREEYIDKEKDFENRKKEDIFCCGVSFWHAAFKTYPYYFKELTYEEISDLKPNLEDCETQHINDDQLVNLLLQMIQIDPRKRISIEDCLTHPYFSSEMKY